MAFNGQTLHYLCRLLTCHRVYRALIWKVNKELEETKLSFSVVHLQKMFIYFLLSNDSVSFSSYEFLLLFCVLDCLALFWCTIGSDQYMYTLHKTDFKVMVLEHAFYFEFIHIKTFLRALIQRDRCRKRGSYTIDQMSHFKTGYWNINATEKGIRRIFLTHS